MANEDAAAVAAVAYCDLMSKLKALDRVELTSDEARLADHIAAIRMNWPGHDFWLRPSCVPTVLNESQANMVTRGEMGAGKLTGRSWCGIPFEQIAVLVAQDPETDVQFDMPPTTGKKIILFAWFEQHWIGSALTRRVIRLGWLTPAGLLENSSPVLKSALGGSRKIGGDKFKPGVEAAVAALVPRQPLKATREVAMTGIADIYARFIATFRSEQNIDLGLANAYGLDPKLRQNVEYCVRGARAEGATSIALDIFWSGCIGDFAATDVGSVSVRSSDSLEITAHPTDRSDAPASKDLDSDIVIMVRDGPFVSVFVVHGWLYGSETKANRWFVPGPRPCCRVPFSVARPLNTLPDVWSMAPVRRKRSK